jgi:putative heme-binding domain-containing protein
MAVLGQYESPMIESNLVTWLPNLSRAARREAIKVWLSRTDRVAAVMAALESGRIGAAELSYVQVNFLRTYRDAAISARALRYFGPGAAARPAVMEQFKGALRIAGSAASGRGIFRARCASCHRLGGEGTRVGPDLAPAKAYGKEKLLAAIIQPSAEMKPGWETAFVETRRRENLVGIIVDENPTTITLRQATGVDLVWPRLNIQSIQPQPWSLMPDGLEQGYSPQSMADLLEYLMTVPR